MPSRLTERRGHDIQYRAGAPSLVLDVNPLGFTTNDTGVPMAARKYAFTEAMQESFDP